MVYTYHRTFEAKKKAMIRARKANNFTLGMQSLRRCRIRPPCTQQAVPPRIHRCMHVHIEFNCIQRGTLYIIGTLTFTRMEVLDHRTVVVVRRQVHSRRQVRRSLHDCRYSGRSETSSVKRDHPRCSSRRRTPVAGRRSTDRVAGGHHLIEPIELSRCSMTQPLMHTISPDTRPFPRR